MDQTETIQRPPGPKSGLIGGNLLQYRRDSLGFLLQNAREYGDLVYFRIFDYSIYQINHPDYVREVLVRHAGDVIKSPIYKEVLARFLGNGLLVSDGEFWKRQRRLAQPAFHVKRIENYAQTMVEYAQDAIDTWQDGETREIAEDMMRITLFIVAKTLFDADVRQDAPRVGDALEVLLHNVIDATRQVITLPAWVPTPARRRRKEAIETLDDIIYRIINERRQSGEDKGDLLSMLLLAEDDEGAQMDDQQVRDEATTIFLAGHETTANALTWTFYLLSQHPQAEARLHAEIDEVLGDRPPTLADLPNLRYTEMVLKESMRLYPPAHGIGRQAVNELELGGYTIPPESLLMISAYVNHRDPRWFPDPERFDPERFSPENEAALPKYAYLPFGGGPRICIGNHFAMMEATLILATIARRFRLRLAPGHQVEPEPLVTLRPRYGMKMRLEARSRQGTAPRQGAQTPGSVPSPR